MKCPYCGGEAGVAAELPPMTRRKLRIYQIIAESGPHGISAADILEKMKPELDSKGGRIMLRVNIHDLNKKLRLVGQRINGARFNGYRLESTNTSE